MQMQQKSMCGLRIAVAHLGEKATTGWWETAFLDAVGFRYHYLGYQQATGAQLKYLVWWTDRPIACLSFGPAAWKVAARDQYIGWTAQGREQRLSWVVNNDRFLIVAGVQIAHLASYVLAASLGRLRADWQQVYGHDLALAETFIERDRFGASCYAAANWICLGETRGRGRNDRRRDRVQPIKTLWVYPLRRDFRSLLTRADGP